MEAMAGLLASKSLNIRVGAPSLLKMGRQSNVIDRIVFNLSKGNYKDFIQQIRSIVQQPGRYSHNRPVLPVRVDVAPRDWLDVVLSTDTSSITLRIRQDNLYLEGYQLPCGQWLEFDKDDGTTAHLIPGSAFLGFTGGYPALEYAGGRSVEGTRVSRDGVIAAVNELAQTNNRVLRARDLTLLIMVICEATRFEEMTWRFANVMQVGSTTTETIEVWMLRLFRAWGDLSGRLIRADADGDDYFRLPTDSPLRQRIQSALDAASYVGLLLGPLSMNPRTSLANGGAYVPRGQPMLEVLFVEILDFSGDLSGTITMTDGLGPQTLFNGRQTVRPGDTLTLNLLNRAVSAWESVVFDYNLTTAQGQYRGTDSWDIFQPKDIYAEDSSPPCKRRVRLSKCKDETRLSGSGEISNKNIVTHVGLFREAWQVIWEVKITAGDGYNPMNVYGSVTVSYSDGAYSYKIKLFSRTSSDNVVVYVGGCVPLTRGATAVPLDVSVNVDVDLWDCIHVFPDRCIARGHFTTSFGSCSSSYGGLNVGKAKSQMFKLGVGGDTNSQVQITSIPTRLSAD
ncbi:hypothetical protein V2J09_022086 [Rumex salicifolius]